MDATAASAAFFMDIRYQIAIEPDISPSLDEAIRGLQRRAFPHEQLFRSSRHYVHVARRGDQRVLAWEGESLVAQSVALWGQALFADGRLLLAAVGNVCSDPDHRGRGLADACMIRVMNLAWRRGCDAALLIAGEDLVDFYARYGFERIDNAVVHTRPDGTKRVRDEEGLMMAVSLGDRPWPTGQLTLNLEAF